MTTIEILNEKVKNILGNRYEASNINGFCFRMDGYKLGNSMVLELIENKTSIEIKKEIAKLCLMIQFGK